MIDLWAPIEDYGSNVESFIIFSPYFAASASLSRPENLPGQSHFGLILGAPMLHKRVLPTCDFVISEKVLECPDPSVASLFLNSNCCREMLKRKRQDSQGCFSSLRAQRALPQRNIPSTPIARDWFSPLLLHSRNEREV